MRSSAANTGLRPGAILAGIGIGLAMLWPAQAFAAGPGSGVRAGSGHMAAGHASVARGAVAHGRWASTRQGSGIRWNIGGQSHPGRWSHKASGPGGWGYVGRPHAGWGRGLPLYVNGPLSAYAPTPVPAPGVQRIEVEWPDLVPTVLGIRRQPAADPVSYVIERGRVRSVVHAAPQVSSGPAVFERERSGAWRKAVRGDGKPVQRVAGR